MPFSTLTNEQILELLAEQSRIQRVPGVALVWVEFVDSKRTEPAVVVMVYAGNHQQIARLPLEVAGLPVIVKVEDSRTRRVLEIIDPREHGGKWPRISHQTEPGR